MAKRESFLFYYIFSILILTMGLSCGATDKDRQVYIVYMGSLPNGEYSPSSHHLGILQEVVGGSFVKDILIRSYKRSFNGFAARLTNQEQQKLSGMEGIVSVFPSRTLQLHTTRSWDFMGFPENVRRNPTVESDIIVGHLDTGIWPESESFNDEGFGPPPKKWKGTCQGGKNFPCNNKLIGARYYSLKPGENSARDKEGHGTHTASTAVGNIVKDVSFYGLAQGTVRGGVPSARIATYKVCNPKSLCDYADILAAFDDAIADGVDIITVSLGTEVAFVFNCDPISIGAFHAMEKGTLTVNGAGNGGPAPGSTGSVAPWVLTVAASSIDRRIIDKIVLGNGTTLTGNSVNSFALNGTKFPLTYFDTSLCGGWQARVCREGCLNSSVVKGRIVLCDIPMGKSEAYRAGAIGSVLKVGDIVDASFVVPLPAVVLSGEDYNLVRSYFFRTELAEATILKSEDVKDVAAPVPGEFSSRGPNSIVPDIMKPDVTAPGIEILAAFSPIAPPSRDPQDRRSVKYSILSGTSVSGPHAAGAAAYVKTFHPDWSPSAIKSALMTTAWPMKATKRFYDEFAIGEFAYGSGHINPIKAVDPGLVYEAYKEDYIKLLCSTGYDEKSLRLISGDNSSCPKEKELARDFNYPSMTVEVPANISFNVSFHRTVTNVGIPNSTYRAKVLPNPKMKVEVVPSILSFKSLNEKKSFAVTVAGGGVPQYEMVSASLVWSDGTHSVRTPIVVSNVSILVS